MRFTADDWLGTIVPILASRLGPDVRKTLARAEREPTTGKRVRFLLDRGKAEGDLFLLAAARDAVVAVGRTR